MSLREEILSQTDLPREKITAFGRELWIRTMTGRERDAYENEIVGDREKGRVVNMDNFRARFLVRCMCYEDGRRIFEDTDAAGLGDTSAKELDRLYDHAARLNRMREEDVAALVQGFTEAPTANS